MNIILRLLSPLLFISLVGLVTGCGSMAVSTLSRYGETNLIKVSYALVDELIEKSQMPLIAASADQPILVSTPVDNNDYSQVSDFGRLLQEQVASRFVQQNYSVMEVNLSGSLDIMPKHGETILSRDTRQLIDQTAAQAIFVATLSQAGNALYINALLVEPIGGTIIAATDKKLILDSHTFALLRNKQMLYIDEPIDEPQPPPLNSILY